MRLASLIGAVLLLGFRPPVEPDGYPRTLDEIKAMTQLLAPKRGTGSTMEDAFLARLRQYRFICGVPFEDLSWDAEYANLTHHASLICAQLDQMTHTPAKPAGMSDDVYQLCRKGAGSSNLYSGRTDPILCVDGWMNDSDERNIDRVGHRRWCINPSMLKSAFGTVGRYAAMYAFDKSNRNVPDWDFVAYPTRGYMPSQFFGARHAWSVSPNTGKYRIPDKGAVKVKVRPATADLEPSGEPLALDYFNVEKGGFGSGPAIIFRPKGVSLQHGKIYLVEIEGVTPAIRYPVHFVSVQKIPETAATAAVYTDFFKKRHETILALPEPIDRIESFESVMENAFLRRVEGKTRSAIQKSFKELLKDPDLKREYVASQRYKQVVAAEAKAGKSKNRLRQVVVAYAQIAKAYEATRAGKRAADAFERLKNRLQ